LVSRVDRRFCVLIDRSSARQCGRGCSDCA
jgi:hypothetical protein